MKILDDSQLLIIIVFVVLPWWCPWAQNPAERWHFSLRDDGSTVWSGSPESVLGYAPASRGNKTKQRSGYDAKYNRWITPRCLSLWSPPHSYLHLFFQLMKELSIRRLSWDAGGTLSRQDGSGDILQTLLQWDLSAAWSENEHQGSFIFMSWLKKHTIRKSPCSVYTCGNQGLLKTQCWSLFIHFFSGDMLSDNNTPEWSYHVSKPVHVSETGQNMSGLAKVTVLLVVTPQQVHIVHLTLVLLDHVHQMFLQVRRIHLDNRGQIKGQLSDKWHVITLTMLTDTCSLWTYIRL